MINKNIEFYQKLEEGLNVELKAAEKGLPKSIWETYSSFANTCGGVIYLGIKEGNPNKIVGINNIQQMKKDFFTLLNNQEKVNRNILKESDFRIIELEDKQIIEIHVPEANVYDKPIYINGSVLNSFKRNYEGDFKINQLDLISLIDDAKVLSRDSLNNSFNFGFEAVDIETLEKFRDELNKSNPNNIFKDFNDEEFMIKAGYINENEDRKKVLTNAGLLLFSAPNFIKRINPNYFLDFQIKIDEDDENWIDRITTDDIDFVGNLYNFYVKVCDKLLTNLPKPIVLKNMKDIGQDDFIFIIREAFLNAITNADFNMNESLKIVKTNDKIIFKNSGRLKIPYKEAIKYGNSDPRNKALMTTFRNLKVCDRGGTGLPRIFKLSKDLNLYRPVLIDDGILNSTILTIYLKANKKEDLDKAQEIISYLELHNDFISVTDLSANISINRTTTSQIVNKLVEDGVLVTNGLQTKGKKVRLK